MEWVKLPSLCPSFLFRALYPILWHMLSNQQGYPMGSTCTSPVPRSRSPPSLQTLPMQVSCRLKLHLRSMKVCGDFPTLAPPDSAFSMRYGLLQTLLLRNSHRHLPSLYIRLDISDKMLVLAAPRLQQELEAELSGTSSLTN